MLLTASSYENSLKLIKLRLQGRRHELVFLLNCLDTVLKLFVTLLSLASQIFISWSTALLVHTEVIIFECKTYPVSFKNGTSKTTWMFSLIFDNLLHLFVNLTTNNYKVLLVHFQNVVCFLCVFNITWDMKNFVQISTNFVLFRKNLNLSQG